MSVTVMARLRLTYTFTLAMAFACGGATPRARKSVGDERTLDSGSSMADDAGADSPIAAMSSTGPAPRWLFALLDRLPGGAGPGGARAVLEHARGEAAPAEMPLIARAAELVDTADAMHAAADASTPQREHARERIRTAATLLITRYASFLAAASAAYPDDSRLQLTVATKLYRVRDYAQTLQVPNAARDDGFANDALARTQRQIARAPGDPVPWGTRASLLEDDPLAAMRAYVQCMQLAKARLAQVPGDADEMTAVLDTCRRRYADVARVYSAPGCRAAALRPQLGIFYGTTAQRPGTRAVAAPGGPIWVEPKAPFGVADMGGAREVAMVGKPAAVVLLFTPARAAAYDAWLLTRVSPGLDSEAAVLLGDRHIGSGVLNMRRFTHAESGVEVSGLTIDAVCATVTRAVLPLDLAPP